MDFSFTPEQERFRRDVRAFFAEERVQTVLGRIAAAPPRADLDARQIYRWLGERGWLAPNWPTEYGGLGASPIEAAIVYEEMIRRGVPDLPYVVSVFYVGTFLLLAGTAQQKARFLGPMARGQMNVAVLYSEPAAGSDLTALTTRADLEDATFVLRGTKIYSQTTQFAQYGLVTARTAVGQYQHEGITLFMVPLDHPGVEVNRMWNLSDEHFSEVVLDGARVSADHVIGPLHNAWSLINGALAIERTGLEWHLKMRRWLDAVIERAHATGRLTDPRVGQQIVELDAEIEAGRIMAWRNIAAQARGELDEVATAMSKWHNTEVGRRIVRVGLEIDGLEGVLSRWDPEAPAAGELEAACREVPGITVSAGSSEIMLYLIAAAGLRAYE